MLINLLGNAVKFTDHGEIVCRIKPLRESGKEVWMHFEITDTGMGIPQEHQQKIFESFRQVDNSNTRAHGGCGLGLAICKRLIEHMGGHIGVDSVPGQGSRFWFTLPLFQEDAPLTAPTNEKFLPRGLRVMVVDDHAINRKVLSRLLTRWQVVVETFESGAAALDRLSASGPPFDVILMDCQMPVMDGFEATRQIRSRFAPGHGPVIIALTAHAIAGDRELCLAAGMDDYLPKPIRAATLIGMLKRLTNH